MVYRNAKLVDAETQTDNVEVPLLKTNNFYKTPERKIMTSIDQFISNSPINLDQNQLLVLPQINIDDLDHLQDYNLTQQRLLNVITPKSNFAVNSNNFKSNINNMSIKSRAQYENINLSKYNLSSSPVSTKSWRSNNRFPRGRKLAVNENLKTTPKLQRATNEFRTKYSRSGRRYLLDAYQWFKDFIQKNISMENICIKKEPIIVKEFIVQETKQDSHEMFLSIREEIQDLKKMIIDLKENSAINPYAKIKTEPVEIQLNPASPPPMVARPPPPPPPPPPMPVQLSMSLPTTVIKKAKSSNKPIKTQNEDRPEISLADILKVKLRKPCERPEFGKLPKSKPRATSTPMVTLDELKKVNLKPVTKLTIPSKPEISSPNSPISSLKRLLTNGSGNESRPKRMRQSFKDKIEYGRERVAN